MATRKVLTQRYASDAGDCSELTRAASSSAPQPSSASTHASSYTVRRYRTAVVQDDRAASARRQGRREPGKRDGDSARGSAGEDRLARDQPSTADDAVEVGYAHHVVVSHRAGKRSLDASAESRQLAWAARTSEQGAPHGIHRDHTRRAPVRTEKVTATGDRAGRAGGDEHNIDGSIESFVDLAHRSDGMGSRVFRVRILIRPERAGRPLQKLCHQRQTRHEQVPGRGIRLRDDMHRCAERAHRLHADRRRTRVDDADEAHAMEPARPSKCDTQVSRARLDHRRAGTCFARRDGILQHSHCRAILCASGRVEELELRPDVDVVLGVLSPQPYERRLAHSRKNSVDRSAY